MIQGSCLCGGVQFQIARILDLFELCHCRRCRKATGSAFAASFAARQKDVQILRGTDLIATYEAPIVESPPAYRTSFCRRCGSPVPDPNPGRGWFKIDAGVLDDDLGMKPQRHIHVDRKAPWFEITDDLPRFEKRAHIELRALLETLREEG